MGYVKVWNLTNCKLKTNHVGHTGYLNTVTLSPDGSLCASGGKDGKAMLWDLTDDKHLYTLENHDIINSLVFSPVHRPRLVQRWPDSVRRIQRQPDPRVAGQHGRVQVKTQPRHISLSRDPVLQFQRQ